MAIGDIVGQVYQVNTIFQPAASVTIVITQLFGSGPNGKVEGLGDYDTFADNFTQLGSTSIKDWGALQKIFIDNAKYLQFKTSGSASTHSGFTGMQIK